MYLLPTFFMWKLVPKDKYVMIRFWALFMAVFVSILSLGSFTYKIHQAINGNKTTCDNVQHVS